jgi:hypothetical protein
LSLKVGWSREKLLLLELEDQEPPTHDNSSPCLSR